MLLLNGLKSRPMFEYGDNGERTSIVSRAVFGLSARHDMNEATDYDRRILKAVAEPPSPTKCVLRSSSEEHWVSHFAWLCLEQSRQHRPHLGFHTFCEIPSKRSEKLAAGGYDLSLGPYDTDLRLRTMHKTTPRRWCDRPWTVTFNRKDIAHLQSLAKGRHSFYVVVHAFYCIHDWRRMGRQATPDEENRLDSLVNIPSVTSLARTVIFEMNQVRTDIERTQINHFKIVRVASRAAGNIDVDRLASLVRPDLYCITMNGNVLCDDSDEPLRPMTLDNFLSGLDDRWKAEWKDSAASKVKPGRSTSARAP